MQGTVTMYSTTWCGYCRRLKSQMGREGIEFTEVDIEQDPASAEVVAQANGGNQTVPTLVFADGTAPVDLELTGAETLGPAVRLVYDRRNGKES